jgi:hypothetical protein
MILAMPTILHQTPVRVIDTAVDHGA